MLDSKFIKKWERNRKRGRLVYALFSCVIMSSSFLAGAIIAYLFTGKISLYTTMGLMIGGLIGGAIGGILKWTTNEKKYMKLTNTDQD